MSEKNSLNKKIITKLFFRLLPVQILLVAISGINSIIDGAIAGKYIGVIALTVIGLYYPMLKVIDAVNALLTGGSQILYGCYGRVDQSNTKRGDHMHLYTDIYCNRK